MCKYKQNWLSSTKRDCQYPSECLKTLLNLLITFWVRGIEVLFLRHNISEMAKLKSWAWYFFLKKYPDVELVFFMAKVLVVLRGGVKQISGLDTCCM